MRQLLHNDAIAPQVRLAGCLVALCAQPVARIVRLTADDLHVADEIATVRLGTEPVSLPAPLRPIAELVIARARHGWLFPGQKPGQPIHPSHLARRLRIVGVPVARTRPAGLAALAHRIPPSVLADMLGLSTSTVCRTAEDLKADYARYVARRT